MPVAASGAVLGPSGLGVGGGCGGGASFMDVRFVRGGSRVEHRLVDVVVVAGCCEYSCRLVLVSPPCFWWGVVLVWVGGGKAVVVVMVMFGALLGPEGLHPWLVCGVFGGGSGLGGRPLLCGGGCCPVWWGFRAYVENCIVDASIFEFLWSSC